jgi:tetratricopeptide (TPR) repeat protein
MKAVKVEQSKSSNSHIQHTPHTYPWWAVVIPPFILSFIGFLFYRPSLHYDFQFDDIINIQKFYSIRHHTFSTIFLNGPRWVSYWLNSIHYRIGKFNPYSYRLFNVCMHLSLGILLFYFFYWALSRRQQSSFFSNYRLWISLVAAGLFMLHPVQTQTISYVIQGQLEGLATFFSILMCLTFLAYASFHHILARITFAVILLALGFFGSGTKEIMIVSPFLLLLVDWFFVAQGDFTDLKKRALLHLAIFMTVWGMYIYYLKPSFFTQALGMQINARNNIGNILTERQTDPITPLHFLISQFKVILHYLAMFVWPFSISVEYDWKLVAGFFAPDCIIPFILLIAGAWYIARLLRKDRTSLIGFAALWFLIAIAPRSSIIPSSELLADYKTYMASCAVLFLLSSGIVWLVSNIIATMPNLVDNWQPKFKTVATAGLICLMLSPIGYLARERNKVWRSGEDFWTNIIANAPGKARAYNNLGVAYSEKGKMLESIPLYKKAIAMDRNYPDPWNNLAVAYSATDKLDMAINTMKQALAIHRNYPEGYNNLASFLIAKKEYAEAEKMLQIAIKLRPFYGKAYFNLGKMYAEQNKKVEALDALRNACTKADLDNQAGFTVYAAVAMAAQSYKDAIFAYSKLLEIDRSYETTFNLAHAYALDQQYQESINIYRMLASRNPADGRSWYNLGECYLRIKNQQEALTAFQQANALNFPMPNLKIRIAGCLHDLGRIAESKKMLEEIIAQETSSPEIKQYANAILSEVIRTEKAA